MRATIATLLCVFGGLVSAACDDTPTSPTDDGPPYTVTFVSTVSPGGTASRTISAGGAGTVSLSLESTDPAGTPMTIGVGIPDGSRTGCGLTQAVTGAAAIQLQAAVDAGDYCVQVSDPDRLSRTTGFSLTIIHP